MSGTFFLGQWFLYYLVVIFPTASVLILLHRPIAAQLSRYHWLAYWLICALLLFEAWRLINRGDKIKPWLRKPVAGLVLLLAFLVCDVAFPNLLEGHSSTEPVVTFLLVVLAVVAVGTGVVATVEHRIASCDEKDLTQARGIQKGSWVFLGTIVGILGGSGILSSTLQQFYVEMWGHTLLMIGASITGLALLLTFFIIPWIIVRQLETPGPPTHHAA